MGRPNEIVIALLVAIAPPALHGCGDVSVEDDVATVQPENAGGRAQGSKKHRGRDGGAAGTGGISGGFAGASGAGVPTEPIDPASTCSICVRAENCCKAQGLTDCNYGQQCADATPLEQSQFYLVLCRAMLEASQAGHKAPPDVCGF